MIAFGKEVDVGETCLKPEAEQAMTESTSAEGVARTPCWPSVEEAVTASVSVEEEATT